MRLGKSRPRRDAPTYGAYGYGVAADLRSRTTPIALALVVGLFAAAIVAVLLMRPDAEPGGPPPERPLLSEPPVAMPNLGSLVQTRIGPDDEVRVTHWIQTYSPLSELEVVPSAPRPGVEPEATDVTVTTAAERVTGPRTVAGDPVRYDLAEPARLVRVTYRLSGVLDRRSTVAGRVLARLTALPLRYEGRAGPTVYTVSGGSGGTVLTVACEDPATVTVPAPCGAPDGEGDTWRVRLDGARRDDQVLAQLDLG